MALSRNTRTDRRRQILRLAAESENEAGEYAPRVQRKRPKLSELDREETTAKRDAGYSQAVRQACQQRLVQLIPVRRTSLAAVLAVSWMGWALLLSLHYLFFVRGSESLQRLPISYLFHIRNNHSIAHWLGTQLWMLTALSAFLIYQLRKHKLDDYRAKYRVWLALVAAALFASLDSSSSLLLLLGASIDGWARSEVGYSGIAVVLATFASMVGVLGLRLCGELRSAPSAIGLWLGGLISWGISALFGTNLIHSPWPQATLELVVGGSWLGGILAVWLASGIYLRQIYIQAQKRFVLRNSLLQPIRLSIPKWNMPKWRRADADGTDESEAENATPKRRMAIPGLSRILRRKEEEVSGRPTRDSDARSHQRSTSSSTATSSSAREEAKRDMREQASREDSHTNSGHRSSDSERSKDGTQSRPGFEPSDTAPRKGGLFGFARRSRPDNGSTHSQSESPEDSPRRKDIEPLAKLKRDDSASNKKWWSFSKNKDGVSDKPKGDLGRASAGDSVKGAKDTDSEPPRPTKSDSRSWFRRKGEASPDQKDKAGESTQRASAKTNESPKKGWFSRTKGSVGEGEKKQENVAQKQGEKESKGLTTKRSWFQRADKPPKSKPSSSEGSKPDAGKPEGGKEGTKKKGLFSFMDGLKLKPPSDASSPAGSGPKPVSNRPGSMPSTMPEDGDPEDRSDLYERQMSKAERKKMRRDQGGQGNQRRAA